MVTKRIVPREVGKVKKLTSEFGSLKSISAKHFTRRDRKLLMERLARDRGKIQRMITQDLRMINEKITREEKPALGSKKLLRVIDEVLIELHEKQRIFERHVKRIKERVRIVSHKRILVDKRITKLDDSLSRERGKRRFLKNSKLVVK